LDAEAALFMSEELLTLVWFVLLFLKYKIGGFLFSFRSLRVLPIAGAMVIGVVFLFFVGCENQPPSPPIVFGPQRARSVDTVMVSALSVDKEADSVAYYFEWSKGVESSWSEWVSAGMEYYRRVVFPDTGLFFLRVKARDSRQESGWSDTFAVDVRFWTPQVPRTPLGPDTALVGDTVKFISWAWHPLQQSVALQFHWGDTIGDWSGFVPPGTLVRQRYTYHLPGIYEVRCRAKDRAGYVSDWSMPETVLVVESRFDVQGGVR